MFEGINGHDGDEDFMMDDSYDEQMQYSFSQQQYPSSSSDVSRQRPKGYTQHDGLNAERPMTRSGYNPNPWGKNIAPSTAMSGATASARPMSSMTGAGYSSTSSLKRNTLDDSIAAIGMFQYM